MRSASPGLRSMSPSQSRAGTRTIEKYVSTGAAGTPSGIPGLEMLDEELKDVSFYFLHCFNILIDGKNCKDFSIYLGTLLETKTG